VIGVVRGYVDVGEQRRAEPPTRLFVLCLCQLDEVLEDLLGNAVSREDVDQAAGPGLTLRSVTNRSRVSMKKSGVEADHPGNPLC
jgi:hypothetical protein